MSPVRKNRTLYSSHSKKENKLYLSKINSGGKFSNGVSKIQIIVLAAGHGKRMNHDHLPKVLIPLKGKPLIQYLLSTIQESDVCQNPTIVVGQKADLVKSTLGPGYHYVFQKEQLGTGHAVASCQKELEGKAENILVLYGDHPFVSASLIKNISALHLRENKVLTTATALVPDFNDWRAGFLDFGRIVRNGNGRLAKIVEKKDASPSELKIKEVNPAYFCFKASWLWKNLPKLSNHNHQKEYYLTDLVSIARNHGEEIATLNIEPKEALGINSPEQLTLAETLL